MKSVDIFFSDLMNRLSVILLLFTFFRVDGQNLVPNPGFENHTAIPCGFIAGIPLTAADSGHVRSDNIGNYLTDWYAPTSGSTDYWFFSDSTARYKNGNDCALGAELQNNQPIRARTGSGYLGMYVIYSKPNESSIQPDYREYAQVRLLHPLKAKTYYHVSLFAQIGYNSQYCTNRLGILFSLLPITRPRVVDKSQFGQPLSFVPQVMSSQYICQANQWVEISDCFLAEGGEEYITIGNFFDDAHTNQRKTNIAPPGGTGVCYNLIDDITVEEVGSADYLPKANFLGPDTVLCPNQQLLVNILFKNGSLLWSGGDTNHTRVFNQTGVYTAAIQVGQCIVSDTLYVRVVAKLDLPPDTVLCQGDNYTLMPNNTTGQLVWNDGSTSLGLNVSQPGTYWLRAVDHQCSQSDTVHVAVVNCPGFIPNVITPNGDGKNDRFFVENITLTPWKLTICNRWGRTIYYTDHYENEWSAENVPVGMYYYLLQEQRSGKLFKGWVEILR